MMFEKIAAVFNLVVILFWLYQWGSFANVFMSAQAATPAEPIVKECKKVNTAKVDETFTIIVFRCEPENGPPYLLNTFGFMKDEE